MAEHAVEYLVQSRSGNSFNTGERFRSKAEAVRSARAWSAGGTTMRVLRYDPTVYGRKAYKVVWHGKGRRNPSKQKRMATALKKYLHSVYPHKTLAGAKIKKNPGGSITIVPIHLRKRSR